MGKSPVTAILQQHSYICAYPCFFDNKVLLTENRSRAYIQYIKLLVRHYAKYGRALKIAIWPDYTPLYKVEKIANIYLFNNISFIVPIHDLSELEIVDELVENGFRVFAGYASDKKLRDYEINDFLREAKRPLWYLGVSTKKELRELLFYGFDGFDITGYLFGRNEDRKDPKVLKRNLEELLRTISKPQGRQSSILEFFPLNWGV